MYSAPSGDGVLYWIHSPAEAIIAWPACAPARLGTLAANLVREDAIRRLLHLPQIGHRIAAQTDLPRAHSPRRQNQKVARNSSISTKVSSPGESDEAGWLSQSASGS